MRFEHLDLNLLVALDVLLQEQNITRSAERLNLSQSATSGILSRLRDFFEDDLLVQVGKTMQPTQLALELQSPVAEVLATIRSSIIGKKLVDPTKSERHFKIIASDYVIQVLLSQVLVELASKAPKMTFEFLSPFTNEAGVLVRGGADLMIAPDTVMLEGYPCEPLLIDEMVCVADINNHDIKTDITLEEFSQFGHVSVGFSSSSQLTIEKWLLKKMDTERKVEIITTDFSTMLYSLVNTKRIAIVPKLFAQRHKNSGMIKLVTLPFQTPQLKESMMWHPTLDKDPVHRWLREQFIHHSKIFQTANPDA